MDSVVLKISYVSQIPVTTAGAELQPLTCNRVTGISGHWVTTPVITGITDAEEILIKVLSNFQT